jgi:hypothetical protein
MNSALIECDVCHLPDPYGGGGDGIGSCDCPRCDGQEAASGSVLCDCPPNDEYDWRDEGDEDGDEDVA